MNVPTSDTIMPSPCQFAKVSLVCFWPFDRPLQDVQAACATFHILVLFTSVFLTIIYEPNCGVAVLHNQPTIALRSMSRYVCDSWVSCWRWCCENSHSQANNQLSQFVRRRPRRIVLQIRRQIPLPRITWPTTVVLSIVQDGRMQAAGWSSMYKKQQIVNAVASASRS